MVAWPGKDVNMLEMGKTLPLFVTSLVWLSGDISHATTCIAALPIKPIRHVCGVVINPLGEPIAQAEVTVSKDGKEIAVVQTSEDGRFDFPWLNAGKYSIRVEATGYLYVQGLLVVVKPTTKCERGLEVLLPVGGQCVALGWPDVEATAENSRPPNPKSQPPNSAVLKSRSL